MSPDTISAAISLLVAIAILVAGFFQWWDITYDGKTKTRKWIKMLFAISILLLSVSLYLVVTFNGSNLIP